MVGKRKDRVPSPSGSSRDPGVQDSSVDQIMTEIQGNRSRGSFGGKKRSLFAQEVDPNELDRSFEPNSTANNKEAPQELDLNESLTRGKVKRVENDVERMTPQEQEFHYSQCIEMCNKNKVNPRNAFKLQLIDYMNLIVAKRNEKADNLSLMSCTLDASAKIYSFRVDKVYSDMLKIVASKDGRVKLDDDDDDEDSEGGNKKGETSMILENLRTNMDSSEEDLSDSEVDKNQMKFISSPENFNRGELKKAYYGTYMPRGQELFVQSSIGREGGLQLDSPLFEAPDSIPQPSAIDLLGPKISETGPTSLGNLCSIIKGYGDLVKKFHVEDSENLQSVDLNSTFAYDPAVEEDLQRGNPVLNGEQGIMETSPDHEEEADYQGMDYDDFQDADPEEELVDCERIDTDTQSICSRAASAIRKGPRSFSVAEMCRLISEGNSSDYSYFDQSKFDFWKPPKHWKIKQKRAPGDMEPKTSRKKKKKDTYVVFGEASVKHLLECYEGVISHSLLRSTITSWKSEKTIQKREMEELASINYQFFTLDIPLSSNFSDVETSSSTDFDMEGGDNDSCSVISDQLNDLPRSPGMVINETIDESAVLHGNDSVMESEAPCEENGLVPKPRLISSKNVDLQKPPKRIDVKLVKEKIWSFVETKNQGTTVEGVKMIDLYKEISQDLPPDQELTPAMGFLTLLYVANEKNLVIEKDDQGVDIKISLDASTGD